MAPGLMPQYNTSSQQVCQKPTRFEEINAQLNIQLKLVEERTEALNAKLCNFLMQVPESTGKQLEREKLSDTPMALLDLETAIGRLSRVSDRLGHMLDTLGL